MQQVAIKTSVHEFEDFLNSVDFQEQMEDVLYDCFTASIYRVRFCIYCGHHPMNETTDGFSCPNCYRSYPKAPEEKMCKYCKALNPREAIFCRHCGKESWQ